VVGLLDIAVMSLRIQGVAEKEARDIDFPGNVLVEAGCIVVHSYPEGLGWEVDMKALGDSSAE
jgi:hypothetical protein